MAERRACCSDYRCCSIACATCTWRYSLSVTRRIIAYEPRSLHTVMIAGAASSPVEFRNRRKSVHNSIAYRRRQSRWWRSFGLWLWSNRGQLTGLVELDSVTAEEFSRVVQRHGAVSVRPIDINTIRIEVYKAALMLTPPDGTPGRYQPLKIAIEPLRGSIFPISPETQRNIQPMPILL